MDKGIALPEGYAFTPRETIRPSEVIAIRKSVDWSEFNESIWLKCLRESLAVCGVGTTPGLLIGVAFIAGNTRHAVLCELSVH